MLILPCVKLDKKKLLNYSRYRSHLLYSNEHFKRFLGIIYIEPHDNAFSQTSFDHQLLACGKFKTF
jgi:hypothetical protein